MKGPLNNTCPNCGKDNDDATGLTVDDGPKPGDVSICLYCQQVCIFGDQLELLLPDPELRNSLYADPHIKIALKEMARLQQPPPGRG